MTNASDRARHLVAVLSAAVSNRSPGQITEAESALLDYIGRLEVLKDKVNGHPCTPSGVDALAEPLAMCAIQAPSAVSWGDRFISATKRLLGTQSTHDATMAPIMLFPQAQTLTDTIDKMRISPGAAALVLCELLGSIPAKLVDPAAAREFLALYHEKGDEVTAHHEEEMRKRKGGQSAPPRTGG